MSSWYRRRIARRPLKVGREEMLVRKTRPSGHFVFPVKEGHRLIR